MEAIAAGKGKAPKPFMLRVRPTPADAVWDSKPAIRKKPPLHEISAAADQTLPDFLPPQLCTSVDRPPSGTDWGHEVKFDGYRLQLRVQDRAATLKTRKGLDWSAKFGGVIKEAAALPDSIVDGEVVALDKHGAPDFAALQAALSEQKTENLVFFAFDLLFEAAEDLRPEPLSARKARLQKMLGTRRQNASASSSIWRPAAMPY